MDNIEKKTPVTEESGKDTTEYSRQPLFKKRDMIFFVVTLLALVVLLLIPKGPKTEIRAVVRVEGEAVLHLDLDVDKEYQVKGANGVNVRVAVENFGVYISYSECEDGLCKKLGVIKNPGEPLSCEESALTISIEGEKE